MSLLQDWQKDWFATRDVIRGPVWFDACAHGPGDYICTFRLSRVHHDRKSVVETTCDVYLFEQPDGMHVCLRTGDEPENYASPGTLGEFLKHANPRHQLYSEAIELILYLGSVGWKRNNERHQSMVDYLKGATP